MENFKVTPVCSGSHAGGFYFEKEGEDASQTHEDAPQSLSEPSLGADADKGRKNDTGKPRLALLPPDAMFAMARVLTHGADSYSAWNWHKGIAYERLVSASLRHVMAWLGGQPDDPETGESHLAHAMCGLAFALDQVENYRFDTDLLTGLHPNLQEKLTDEG